MPDDRTAEAHKERRAFTRYCVNLKAVAYRPHHRLPAGVPVQVPITVVDISQVSLRWTAKDLFYRNELIALSLATGDARTALRCAVRVYRVRRITNGYEAVGHFLRVDHREEASPAAATPAAVGAET